MEDETLERAFEGDACPHIAILLREPSELFPVLASFYGLGVKRGGWLLHRSRPGEAQADRALLRAAGLDVERLEAERRLIFSELDVRQRPKLAIEPARRALEEAIGERPATIWNSRFAAGATHYGPIGVRFALAYERAWDDALRGRSTITLCPYVVGRVDADAALAKFGSLADVHDGVLAAARAGFTLFR